MKTDIKGGASIEIQASAAKVWEALTTPEIIRQYFFGTHAISDWKEGSPIIFKGDWQGKPYEDKGTILKVEKNRLFRYTYWSSRSGKADIPGNYVTITYELSEKNGHTQLAITQDNIPDEKMKSHSEENWKKVLSDLKNILERESANH